MQENAPQCKFVDNPKVWVIVEDGLIGTQKQCVALAEKLSDDVELKNFQLKQPWKSLSPYFSFGIGLGITPKLSAPWPNIIIAAGRKAIAPALWVKKKSKGACFVIFIQDPRTKHNAFDLICLPEHDSARGENIITMTGALTNISPAMLEQEKQNFPFLSKLPSPRIAVLVGGNSQSHTMDDASLNNIIAALQELQKEFSASLMVTCSRRTPIEAQTKIKDAIRAHRHSLFWEGNGPNPIVGYMGHADYIFVTNDSISMMSEAVSSGKPTYILSLSGDNERFTHFYNVLSSKNLARSYEGKLENWGQDALQEASNIAAQVKSRYQEFVTNQKNKTN
jgi:hypothetical protein